VGVLRWPIAGVRDFRAGARALLGVGAHGAGTAWAHQLGSTEEAAVGLTMVHAGLMNVLAAPLPACLVS
jgi:putative effector of murein hydrolase